MRFACICGLVLCLAAGIRADDRQEIEKALAKPIVAAGQTLMELKASVKAKIPRMPAVKSAAEWRTIEQDLRNRLLDQVVFRGEAAKWRTPKTRVEWLDTVPGTNGYRLRKLRYEALPGMWIPALLYEPEKLEGKVPVSLAVNGHDPNGKASPYKQIRCINMAKRGMIVLNAEWFQMGQLRVAGNAHGAMNQLDLCGTSGLAPFFLNMSRGLDVLLAHEHADPTRVAVSGLSGGGWQTIYISALDPRVTFANPVAGYSSFLTRLEHDKDLGDSEQTPCDMATIADYTHLTAMRAPRATLLTFNSKDDCCFESGYTLPLLEASARPIFKLLGAEHALRTHVNDVPGTHNFEKDNRQALYRMLGDFFFKDDPKYSAIEIPCEKEVKKREELDVPLPADNTTFNSLAKRLSERLPADAKLSEVRSAPDWQVSQRKCLHELLRIGEFKFDATKQLGDRKGIASFWRLKINDQWSVPVVVLARGEQKATTILIGDAGRAKLAAEAEKLLAAGHRVIAVDLAYFGECAVPSCIVACAVAGNGGRSAAWTPGGRVGRDRPLVREGIQLRRGRRRGGRAAKLRDCARGRGVGRKGDRLVAIAWIARQPEGIDRTESHGRATPGAILLRVVGIVRSQSTDRARGAEAGDFCEADRTFADCEMKGLKSWYARFKTDFDPISGN